MNTHIKRAIGKTLMVLTACLLFQLKSYAAIIPVDSVITIPLGGNAWVSNGAKARNDSVGLVDWSGAADVVSVYVRAESVGSLNIDLKLSVPNGSGKIRVTVGETVLTKIVSNRQPAAINFGKAIIKAAGYVQIKLQGLQKSGRVYANVSDLLLSGSAFVKGAVYVKDNHGNYFHWGRRGPSVHLNYRLPVEASNSVEWFYNEVTVPVGNDVIGSYFMADGFNAGYFGMQVNSPTERRVLFSIWSPFETDDPKSIPDSLKINLLKKGEGVHAGEFGGEGSGGQSYMGYPWVAGKTYAFLVHAQADAVSKTTILTAYFKPVDQSSWQLIASFKRPKSGFYLKGLYSFLENFEPDMGNVQRKVFFGNGWVADTAGKWYPLIKALFTGDATANINYRKDYGGGVKGNQFFLRNCGFFDDFSPLKVELMRQQSDNKNPEINFNKLP
jgi:hypothetical protein